jgi:hypothetical protein
MSSISRVKCDRCNKEANNNTSDLEGWITINTSYFYPKQKDDQLSPDLCPTCKIDFFTWIKKTDKNYGTAPLVEDKNGNIQ